MMRRKIIALLMGVLFILMIQLPSTPINQAGDLLHYFHNSFITDTGATNGVTAIYLNYRVFDTLFEALLLLVSIIGIIHFSRHEEDTE